ncbi:MAG: endo-1,4-beta-xylanase [Thermogutta sp.]
MISKSLMGTLKALLICCVFLGSAAVLNAETGDELWKSAEARIDKYRKGDVTITIQDKDGRPVPNATVRLQQTRHRFLFGCNIFNWGRIEDPQLQAAYNERFADLFNYATAAFYWAAYERERGRPNHEYTRRLAEWCRDKGIVVKGHPLAWNTADPFWLPTDTNEILRLQLARIDDCVSHFRGLIDRWAVVNEVSEYDRPEFVTRQAPKMSAMWKAVGQMEFTRQCFEVARKANPQATLIINDYVTSPKFERVIEQLVDKEGRRLYDVIGIQSHMHGGTWPNEKIWKVCERFSRFQVPIHFTETTILSGQRGWERPRPWETTPEGEEYQAHEVVRFYTMLFSHPAVEAITWWDFSDLRAWQGAPAGLVRRDMSPKPAYTELHKLIKGKWWSDVTLTTDGEGKATTRVFGGDFVVSVQAPGFSRLEEAVEIRPRESNTLVLVLNRES